MHQYAADPKVTRYTDWGPNTPAETAAFIASVTNPPPAVHPFAIVTRANQELIGGCEVRVVSERTGRGELGYVLRPPWWNQGYATETAGLLLRYAFEDLGLQRVEATCDPQNVGSARVLAKIGMQRIDLLRQHLLVRGVWRDSLVFAIDRADLERPEHTPPAP